ncbi:hypothetical protein HYALB_00002689 [Hymenoscyphus albidus]|uniref:Secreted protein n=1 Tax=Hymenoscyphus albidus TaxID=595503 RepID=A0A9N9M0K2_9HELO|nr:hypothetical protein HYALB_00002689 [Hymenoscyphus albidus]
MIANVQVVLLALLATASAGSLRPRQDEGVKISQLNSNGTGTKGLGDISAAGTLEPFGSIGVGCGINWNKDVSYGGGVQAGSTDYGLGGGFTISPKNITIGLGIGLNGDGSNASIDFVALKEGTFELTFTTSKKVECKETQKDGNTVTTCKST